MKKIFANLFPVPRSSCRPAGMGDVHSNPSCTFILSGASCDSCYYYYTAIGKADVPSTRYSPQLIYTTFIQLNLTADLVHSYSC